MPTYLESGNSYPNRLLYSFTPIDKLFLLRPAAPTMAKGCFNLAGWLSTTLLRQTNASYNTYIRIYLCVWAHDWWGEIKNQL